VGIGGLAAGIVFFRPGRYRTPKLIEPVVE
jgi:hypothetical protein